MAKKKHHWTATYPRSPTWPIYKCEDCSYTRVPTIQELNKSEPPEWWNSECKPPPPLTRDDIEWLTGTGRYGQ